MPFEEVGFLGFGVVIWRGGGGELGGFLYCCVSEGMRKGTVRELCVHMRLMVGFLVLNCPRVDMVAVG